MDLIFATHNQHKLGEVQKMLPSFVQLKSLTDIGFTQEIIEDGDSFKANAAIKAQTIFNDTQQNVFADDSGLVIPSLGGAPGIFSARYAGTGNSRDNIDKVLHKLHGKAERKAYFICVVCLIYNGEILFFEGQIHGVISLGILGENGFGYDPIFIPENHTLSFAQMPEKQKNTISHRALAIKKLNNYLLKISNYA